MVCKEIFSSAYQPTIIGIIIITRFSIFVYSLEIAYNFSSLFSICSISWFANLKVSAISSFVNCISRTIQSPLSFGF